MSGVDRVRVVHPEGGRLMTKQAQAMDTDINAIVARHVAHGAPFFPDGRATYGDFSGVGDYHSALNRLKSAQDEFGQLPAAVRDHCRNDPGEFLSMVYDPERRPELEKLGLVEAAVPAAAPRAELAAPAAPVAPVVGPGAPPGTVAGT